MAQATHRRFPSYVVAFLLCTLWSCGDPPNAPETSGLPFTAGRYVVFLAGFDLTTDPRVQVCSPIGVPPGGKNLQTTVDLQQESSVWVARSTSGAGDLVTRFEASGASSGSTTPIQGTVTGSALWSDSRFPTVDLRVRFEGAGIASGQLTRAASFVNGQIIGTIVFSDSSGAASTCPMVLWTMQPAR